MKPTMVTVLAAVLAFLVLDGIWLGVLMKEFYRSNLAPIARMSDGALSPIWSVGAIVYVLLGIGVAVLVVPGATSAAGAAGLGALFGLVVYGVYDLTNYATLAQWPPVLTLVDIAWGTFGCAAVAALVFTIGSR